MFGAKSGRLPTPPLLACVLAEAGRMDPDRQALIALLEMLSLHQYVPQLVAPAAKRDKLGEPLADATEATSAAKDDDRVRSIDDLVARPHVWQRVIKKRHHRDILEGYLSVREKRRQPQTGGDDENGERKNIPSDVEAAERRFQTFQTIKTVLKDLRELNLERARLDQRANAIIRGGSSSSLATRLQQQRDRLRDPKRSGMSSENGPSANDQQPKEAALSAEEELEQVREDIRRVVDRIDVAKDRLEVAQEMLGFSTAMHKPTRPASASTGRNAPSMSHRPFDPLKTVRPLPPNVAEDERAAFATAPPSRPASASVRSSTRHNVDLGSSRPRKAKFAETADTEEADAKPPFASEVPAAAFTGAHPPQQTPVGQTAPNATRVRVTDAFADVVFVRASSAASCSTTATTVPPQPQRTDPSLLNAKDEACHGPSRATSIGPGWFRSLPRTRSDLLAENQVLCEVLRRQQRAGMSAANERRLDADVQKAVADAAAARADLGKRGATVLPSAPVVASVGSTKRSLPAATFRPRTASTRHQVTHATNKAESRASFAAVDPRTATDSPPSMRLRAAVGAKERFSIEQSLVVAGIKASTMSLGVETPLDHGVQMRCGAVLRSDPTTGATRGSATGMDANGPHLFPA
jgi:hypothetical protein